MIHLRPRVAALLLVVYASAIGLPCEPAYAAARTGPPSRAGEAAPADASHAGHGEHAQGEAGADAAEGGHAHHAARASDTASASTADADEAHCHAPSAQWVPRCPCGCDEKSRARTPGAKLGPAIPVEAERTPDPVGPARAPSPPSRGVVTPCFLLDPVPI